MNSPPQSAQVNVLSDSATGQPPWKWLLYAGLNMLVYEAMSETLWVQPADTFSIYTLVLVIATGLIHACT